MHGDLVAAACAVLCVPPDRRKQFLQSLFEQAHVADVFRQRTGKLHPVWGNGSLMATARREQRDSERDFTDLEYVETFKMVLSELAVRLQSKELA